MTFKFFKISLVSVAKLPHTDTYYACFEHNTIENDACIVNFNDKIDTSKVKAFTQLINFYSFKDLVKKDYRHNNNKDLALYLFAEVVYRYSKSKKNSGIGLYADDYHPFQGLSFEDYAWWETIYNRGDFFKYKKQLKFLPLDEDNDNISVEKAYNKVISYLENNPIYIPLFLYALYSFFSSLSDYMYVFDVRQIHDEDIIVEKDNRIRLIRKDNNSKDDKKNWIPIDFYLWLHSKNIDKLNIAANLFLNVFPYGYNAIKNPYNFHVNISKGIDTSDIKYTDSEDDDNRKKVLKKMRPNINTYENFNNIPIIVYSESGQLSARSKIVQSILYNPNLEDVNFVFQSVHKNRKPVNYKSNHWMNINLSKAQKISKKDFDELKPYVNAIYRHVVEELRYWADTPNILYNDLNKTFKSFFIHRQKLYYCNKGSNILIPANYKDLFYNHLHTAEALLLSSLSKRYPLPFTTELRLIYNDDYNALLPKPDTHLESDQELFLNHLKIILNGHINDSPQETVWMDKHKVALGKMEDVYSFNDQIIKEFLDKDIHNTSIALKKYLVSKDIMLKNDKRFVFNKNANSKKYYVYKIRAKYLT